MLHADPVCAEPKLFVGGLRFDVTRDEVVNHFQQYGPLKSCVLLTHKDTGKSKGCAMVLYHKWAHAEGALDQDNGAASDLSAPRPLIVKCADPQRRPEDGMLIGVTPKKLFIGQIPRGISQEQIRSICAPYGEIVDANVMPPKRDNAMGCAFVTYTTWAATEAAFEALNGTFTFPGAGQPIMVKLADAKPQDMQRVGAKRGMMDLMGGGAGPAKRQMMGGGGMNRNMGGMGNMGMAGFGGMGMGMNPMMMGMGGMGMGMPGMMGQGMGMGMMNPGMMGMMGPMGQHMGMMGQGQGGNMGQGVGGNMGQGQAGGGMGQGGGGMGQGQAGGMGQGQAGGMGQAVVDGQGGQAGADGAQGGGMSGGNMGAGMSGGSMGQGGAMSGGMSGGMGGMSGGMGNYSQGMNMNMPMGYGMGMGNMGMGGMGSMGMGGMNMPMPAMGMGMGGMGGMGGGAMGGGSKGGQVMGIGNQNGNLQAAKAWKLFIGQISFDLAEGDLFPFFSQFGTVLELVLLRNPGDNRHRGCGFLVYNSAEGAETALAANEAVLPNDTRQRKILVRYANQKG